MKGDTSTDFKKGKKVRGGSTEETFSKQDEV